MTSPLIDRVRERLAAEAGPLRPSVVARAIRAESGGVLGDTDVLANLRVLQTELTGAGLLEPLLAAPGTTDVLVTGPDQVWVDDGHGLRPSAVRFPDDAAVRRLAQRLALAAGRRLDDAAPTEKRKELSPSEAAELLQITNRMIKTVPEVERVFGKAGRAETATDPAPRL